MDISISNYPKNNKWLVIDHHYGMVERTVLAVFSSVTEAAKYVERIFKEARAGRKKGGKS